MEPVEIRGEGVDSARVVAALRARAARRPQVDLPPGDLDLPPPLPAERAARLCAWLDRARRVAQRLAVDPRVGWHTPVLGPVWNLFRRVLYRDLRLYADAVVSKQMVYNEALVEAVTLLVERVAALEERVSADRAVLTSELARLATHVERLAAQLDAVQQAAGRGAARGDRETPP